MSHPQSAPAPYDAREILERMRDAHIVLDAEYRFVYANPAAERDMRKTLAELRGRVHWEVFPASHDIAAGRAYRAAAETKVPQHVREHYRFEGYDMHLDMSAYPTEQGGVAVFWRDISDLVKTEQALRDSRALAEDRFAELEQVYRHAPVGLCTLDRDYRFTRINERMAEMNGFAVDAHLGRTVFEILPTLADGLTAIYRRVLDHGESVLNMELQGETAAAPGVLRDWIINYHPLRAADGSITGLIAAVLEVTERKAAERRLAERDSALRESEERMRRIFAQAPAAVVVLRGDRVERLVFELVNDRYLELLPAGRTFVDRRLLEVVPELGSAALVSLRQVLDTGEPVVATEFHQRVIEPGEAVPEDRYFNFVYHPLRDASGTITGVVGVGTEVTGTVQARRTAEALAADLRASEERYALAARATHHAIWEWDLVTDGHSWAPGGAEAFGYDPESLPPGISWWTENVHPDDVERIYTSVRAVIDGGGDGREWRGEYRFRRGDGEWAQVIDQGFIVRDAAGRPVRMIGALQDVTAQRQLEDRLRQAQKMEAIGKLAGGIAHDFNNLLTVVSGSLEFVLRDLPVTVPHDHHMRADLAAIGGATDRARALVRQLLTFSRKQPAKPRVVDVGEVVRGMNRMLRRLIGEEITLEIVVEAAATPVLIDPGELEQVLMNLVVNARDALLMTAHGHVGQGGTLTVEVATHWLDEAAAHGWPPLGAGPYVQIVVRDTGHGMDAQTLSRVFEPYFTTKDVGAGTGMGLAAVDGIVRQAGGSIRAESTPGSGSAFTLLLPATSHVTPPPTASPPRDEVRDRSLTVLVVEDEAPVRALVRRVLERSGHQVMEARHGLDAVALWQEHHHAIDVVLTDVRMPEMGGLELVHRLRRDRPALPAIFISGYTEEGVSRTLGPGDRFVEKPFTADALLDALAALMARDAPQR